MAAATATAQKRNKKTVETHGRKSLRMVTS